jgi:hypothetical protein
VTASFHHCTVPDTNSSILGLVGAPLVTASFHQCTVPETNPSLNGSIATSLVATSFHQCTMPDTNSSILGYWDCLVHPSWLHHFTIEPCLIQTPPFLALFAHPSWLHRFTFELRGESTWCRRALAMAIAPPWHRFTSAPCPTQTPPFRDCLAHPSWLQLHGFRFAPCLTPQTPP